MKQRRSYDSIKDELNYNASIHNQMIMVIEYNKFYIKFSNDKIFTDKILKKFRAIFVKGDCKKYYTMFDCIITSSDPYQTMVDCVKEVKRQNTKYILNREPWNKGLKGSIPWNKGKKNCQIAWNKGLTKHTSPSVMAISQSKLGDKNPMFGHRWSDEYKNEQSERVKESILNGDFTPNPNNRLSRWKNKWNGTKYRSSWEMRYHKLHPHLEYEKIRIPYEYNGKHHIYITDFVDEAERIIYEIKPSNLVDDDKVKAKILYANNWCSDNGYVYKIITEIDEPRMVIDENKKY